MNPKPSLAKGMPRSRSSPSRIGLNSFECFTSPKYKSLTNEKNFPQNFLSTVT